MADRAGPEHPARTRPVAPEPEPPGSTFHGTMQAVAAVVAPASLLTALLYYFGWIRSYTLFSYFGVDVAVLGFTTQDYLLRSVEPLYGPIGIGLLVALGAVVLHGHVRQAVHRSADRRLLRAGRVLVAIGLGGLFAGIVYSVTGAAGRAPVFATPALLVVAVVLTAYGRWIVRRWRERWDGAVPESAAARTTVVALTVMLLVASSFWLVTEYARAIGRGLADHYASRLDQRPGVVVVSTRRLELTGPGVSEAVIEAAEPDGFTYRYSGLRLLVFADRTYYLLPGGWTPGGTAPTFRIPADLAGARFEFVAGVHP